MEPWLATVELVDVLGEEPTCYDSAKRGHQKKEEVKASSPRGLSSAFEARKRCNAGRAVGEHSG